MTLQGLLAGMSDPSTMGGDYWKTVGTPNYGSRGDGTEYWINEQGALDLLKQYGMTPEQAQAKGLRYVTGDYGKDQFVAALVDAEGNVVGQRVMAKSDPMKMLGQFGLGTLAMVGGIGALGLPLTPGAAAAPAAGGAGGAVAPAAGGATGAGTVAGGGAAVGGGAAAGGSGAWVGEGVASGIPAWDKAAGGAGGGMLSGLLSDPLKAAVIGAGAYAGSRPQSQDMPRMDPRMEQYVYNSLLPAAQEWFNANKTGINNDMQTGWNMQRNVYTSPVVHQQLAGLLQQFARPVSVAGNPFMKG